MNYTKLAAPVVLLAAFAMTSAGCAVNTSANINFDADAVQYDVDTDTGMCFAYVASRKSFNTDTTGLGITFVPATPEVIKQIDQDKLDLMEKNGVELVKSPYALSAPAPAPK